MSLLAAPESPVATAVVPSPNLDERRDGRRPDIILLHYTGMPDAEEALRRLCTPAAKVSCHYLVFEDGRTVQLVPEARRAWHAGISSWEGLPDVNSRSIGIEIANPGHDGGLPPYPPAQIAKVIALCLDLARRWSVRPDRVIGHSDVAPERKDDPGELFPWGELYRAGVGHWVEPVPVKDGRFHAFGDRGEAVRALQAMLSGYGYGQPVTGLFDAATAAVVRAFQRHFRPERIDGAADPSTVETLANLIAARPVSALRDEELTRSERGNRRK
jgi:N-acetylmuramoyl-L-alanine amidase